MPLLSQAPTIPLSFAQAPIAQQSDHLARVLTTAASHSLPPKPVSVRKPYLSSTTRQLISGITSDQHAPDQIHLRKVIKKSAKQDRKRWILDQIAREHQGGTSSQWRTIHQLRATYQPRTKQIRFPDGRLSTARAKPEALAQHLVADVWNSVDLPPLDSTPLYPPQACNLQPFTIVELYGALKRSKSGKAPGPDSISMDWMKGSPPTVFNALTPG